MSNLDNKIQKIIINLKEKDKVLIIGIDGPTAAGKTTLADNLTKNLKKKFDVFTFRLDWTLKDRKTRENSLKNFKLNNINFYLEAENHMHLNKTTEFLKKINSFNNSKLKKTQIILKNLYDRSGSTKNDLTIKKNITKNTIIFVEGHYSGYNKIYNFLDYNILLLSDKHELLKRKIERVKNYRNPIETAKYFDLIDIPSFVNYLTRFGNNYNIVIDNSDYLKPIVKNNNFINTWIQESFNLKKKILKFDDLIKNLDNFDIFKKDLASKKIIKKVFNCIVNIDNFVNKNFILSVDNIKSGLFDYTNSALKKVNQNLNKKKLLFKYTNSFHNLYYKKLPITIGLDLFLSKDVINILLNIERNKLNISFFWKGGSETIEINRGIGESLINKKSNSEYSKENILKTKFSNNNELFCYIPTDFTYINFFEKFFSVKKILINQEDFTITASEIKEKLYTKNIFWIHRFAKFSERNFFSSVSTFLGAETYSINNYLFIFKSNNFKANQEFRSFFRKWSIKKYNQIKQINKSNVEYDKLIDQDRIDLTNIINNKSKTLRCLDGQIYIIPNLGKKNHNNLIQKDIFNLLNSNKRIVRKSVVNFLINNNLIDDLDCDKLWPKENLKGKISLKKFINISPTILSDMYFWMNLKSNNNAILAANVYDIRSKSLDIHAYLESSQKHLKPIVLQSSFNAIGQKEKYDNKFSEGYLKLKDGPNDFIENVYKSARDLFLKNNKDFLFGIGLDHIDFRYNLPKGRINRFLNLFKNINNVTHFTLDSSYLLEDKKINNFSKEKKKIILNVLKNEISLLNQIKNNHIYDFEFCANELNYIENQKKVYIPSQNDMEFFAETFFNQIDQSKIRYFNSRPKLIIGNLGTVHHGKDGHYIKSEVSKEWIDKIKNLNFISAVLHGTSRSAPSVLKRATNGCFKINVAGDFLQILIANLPPNLKRIVADKNDNEKKKLYLIRNKMNLIKKKQVQKISRALSQKCLDLMNLIKTPSLTKNDINYFKYRSYNITQNQAHYISQLVGKNKSKFNTFRVKKKIKPKFLLSPIEIKYGPFFKKLVNIFLKKDLNVFHLDVGDGKFINRKLDVSEKLKYVKNITKKNVVHLHLMVKNLDNNKIFDKYIRHYSKLGADFIGIHRQSFNSFEGLEKTIIKIIELNKKPGLFLEVNEEFDEKIIYLIKKYKISWIIFMGVPIGYGGQLFNQSIIPNIIKAQKFLKKLSFKTEIEIDGGLTKDVLGILKKYNINFYAGWSIINGSTLDEIENKLDKVIDILSEN